MSELLGFVHRLVFKLNLTFRSVHLFPFSGQRLGKPLGPVSENSCCVGSKWQACVKSFCHLAAGNRNSLVNTARGQLKCDGTSAENRFRLSAKRTNPFKSAGASVQSTTGNRGVRISGSNAGYTMFRGSVKSTGNPLHLNRPEGVSSIDYWQPRRAHQR